MTRRRIVQVQLALLAVLTVALVVRHVSIDEDSEWLLSFTDISPGDFVYESISVDEPVRVKINCVGVRESEGGELAAYGWVLSRDQRKVVWRLDGPTDDKLVTASDSVLLEPGHYDVYYAALGNRVHAWKYKKFLGLRFGDHWTSKSEDWKLQISGPTSGSPDRIIRRTSTRLRPPDGPTVLWSTGALGGHEYKEHLFEVTQPVQLSIYSIGEFCDGACDYGWIEDVRTGERIWELSKDNTVAAGGMPENRLFNGTLSVGPGVYRAAFKTDPGHAADRWMGNPPYDPAGWGLTISVADQSVVQSVEDFDPWRDREILVRLKDVPNETHVKRQFVVTEPFDAIVYAVGELRKSGNLYDYGWIENNDTQQKAWEMSWKRSRPGGGHHGNREEVAFLHLEPGTYTMHYQTDDSHAYGSWSNGRPDHPDRWGVAIFPAVAGQGAGKLMLLEDAPPPPPPPPAPTSVSDGVGADPESPVAPPTAVAVAPTPARGSFILEATSLGNDQRIQQAFMLNESARVQIQAVGEISLNGRYDYGWLERASTGETVWEMTWQNTKPAGGDDRNRIFDGYVDLDEGKYLIFYKTDFSHAYGDFDGDGPTRGKWGIVMRRID